MSEDDLLYLGHMLDMALLARRKVAAKTREDFDDDDNLRLALTHLLQIIGEAARRVSPDMQAAHPEIPWKAIIGMRHKVVHDYMGVDLDVVWDTAINELEPLIAVLERALPPES